MDTRAKPQFEQMVTAAAVGVHNLLPAESEEHCQEIARIALGVSGALELLDEVDWMREVEHDHITRDLRKGNARTLVRQLTGQARMLMASRTEQERIDRSLALSRTCRIADRALGITR